VWHGSPVRRHSLPAGASWGSIPQTWSPAQGAARAAADTDRAQKTGLLDRELSHLLTNRV
jgi:hypothetical protein